MSRKTIVAEVAGERRRIAWLSFQPDNSISFGLQDRTYIAPRFKAQLGLWNAFNRIRTEYFIRSQPDTTEPVVNPHFTYHPNSAMLQLRATGDEPLFRAVAPVPIVLDQDGLLPWLRMISAPFSELAPPGPRREGTDDDDIVVRPPVGPMSIRVDVDFVPPVGANRQSDLATHFFTWGEVAVRVIIGFTRPQRPALWWYHFS